jgi:hypothetical protein
MGQANVIRLLIQETPLSESQLETGQTNAPVRKVETASHGQRKQRRAGLFVPAIPWLELTAALSRLSTSRAAALWLMLTLQSKLEGGGWLKPRLSLLQEAGLADRKTRSRAISELERAGLVDVERRKGKAPLVRLRTLAAPD